MVAELDTGAIEEARATELWHNMVNQEARGFFERDDRSPPSLPHLAPHYTLPQIFGWLVYKLTKKWC
jgi:hypothetical protein